MEHVGGNARAQALDDDDGGLVAADFGLVDFEDFDVRTDLGRRLDDRHELIERLAVVGGPGMHQPGLASAAVIDRVQVARHDRADFVRGVSERGRSWRQVRAGTGEEE